MYFLNYIINTIEKINHKLKIRIKLPLQVIHIFSEVIYYSKVKYNRENKKKRFKKIK